MSDFELKILQRVRLCEKVIYLKVSPKSTTFILQNVFRHETMYNFSLQYIRQLDNSICHGSNITCCTNFGKDFEF